MSIISLCTPQGDVWLHGDPAELESHRPVVVVIAGLFCRSDAYWFRMQPDIPEAAVFAAQLPGHLCPVLKETSMPAFIEAFGYAIERLFGGRPVLVCGDSLGGVLTLGLPNPTIGRLALDPPMRTGRLWALKSYFVARWVEKPDDRPFLSGIFGFDGEDFRDINYMPLAKHRARVLVGGVPFDPPREIKGGMMPSLVEDRDKAVFAAAPTIHSTVVTDAGHVLVWYEHLLAQVIRDELRKTIAFWQRTAPVVRA